MTAPSGKPRRTWRRKLLFAAVTSGFALLVAAVLGEILLRSFGPNLLGVAGELRGFYRLDGQGGMEPVPQWRGAMTVAGRTVDIALDGLGMRGPEHGPKHAGERRVLFLGDSMVFGNGVAAGEAFPELVGRELGATAGNAGVPGYGPKLAARAFARLDAPFAPDAIVACVFLGNDFDDDGQQSYAIVDGYWFYGPIARLADSSLRMQLATRSRLWFAAEHLLRVSCSSWALALDTVTPEEELAAFAGYPPTRTDGCFLDRTIETDWVARTLDRTVATLAAMRTRAGKRPFLVVVIPHVAQLDEVTFREDLVRQGLDPVQHRRGATQERLLARCAAVGIDALDLTPILRRAGDDPLALFLRDDWHFSPLGHEVAARAVAERLRAHFAR